MGSNPRLLVVGSTNVDLIMRLPHLPAPAETVTDGVFTQVFGGKGANTAVGARRAGAEVSFITATGDDAFGSAARESLAADGIDLSQAHVEAGCPTGTAFIWVDQAGNNSIGVAPGANDRLLPGHIGAADSIFDSAAMVLLQMEIPAATVRATMELAMRHQKPVLLNYAPVRSREIPIDGHINTLVVNEIEAGELTGHPIAGVEDAFDAAARLQGYGPELILVTLGAAGVILVGEDLSEHVPAFRVEVVDTTAAGDIFCGAFATARAEGRDAVAAARFASAASAISITRLGAQPSAPTRIEIEAFLSLNG